MRELHLSLALLAFGATRAQDSISASEESPRFNIDSLIASFQWQTGLIDLADGVAAMEVPASHKYLGFDQAYHLIVDVWENPPSITKGMLGVMLHADADVYSDRPAYVVYYEESGYVNDRDADAIDYDAKLRGMIHDDSLANASRRAQGYGGLQLIGWASPPHYDKQRKVLHWAKEMVSDESEHNVLNYNIRILGRHGVLVINAISTMDHLGEVEAELPAVFGMASFNDGFRHDQYDPAVDGASSKGLAGLLDGKEQEQVKAVFKTIALLAAAGFIGLLLLLVAVWWFFVRKH